MSDEERLRDVSPERQQIARDASNVIKQAASILQKEVAASSVSAADMQQKFAATKRVWTEASSSSWLIASARMCTT